MPQVVYIIKLDPLIVEKRYPTNSVVPTASSSTGTYGRWRFVPSRNIFVLVNSANDNVYIYKLSTQTVPPVGFGSTLNMGEPIVEPNVLSIGIRWDIIGDPDHDSEQRQQRAHLVRYEIFQGEPYIFPKQKIRVDGKMPWIFSG